MTNIQKLEVVIDIYMSPNNQNTLYFVKSDSNINLIERFNESDPDAEFILLKSNFIYKNENKSNNTILSVRIKKIMPEIIKYGFKAYTIPDENYIDQMYKTDFSDNTETRYVERVGIFFDKDLNKIFTENLLDSNDVKSYYYNYGEYPTSYRVLTPEQYINKIHGTGSATLNEWITGLIPQDKY